jgi:hypothetical protein
MQTITLYLGLDVHKDSITIAIAEPGSKGEIRFFGIARRLKQLKVPLPCGRSNGRWIGPGRVSPSN